MKWLNLISIILQFVAFWFAAPELLGAATLKRFEIGLRKAIALLPMLVMFIVALGYGLTFSVLGLLKGIKGSKEGITISEFYSFITVLTIATLAYFVLIAFRKKLMAWLDIKLAKPLTEKLISNNEARSTALVIGAILFTLGFIVQLVVVLIS